MSQINQNKKRLILLIVMAFVLTIVSACSTTEKHEYNPEGIIAEAQQTATIILSFTDTPTPTEEPTATPTPMPTEEPTQETTDDSAQASGTVDISFDPEAAARGELLFITCAACHGPDGRGIVGLGKDLVAGEFALNSTDEEIIAVVTMGRPIWDATNTTGVDMPAKGGNPVLTGDDINDIIAYIRSLQAANTGTSTETSSDDTSNTETESTTYDPELVALGQILFVTCAGCHGPDGRGIPGLGKDFVESEFIPTLTDDELVAFITTGRPIWDAANTTGVDMPPKGGNPALSSEDLYAIVAYIRSLKP